MIHWRLGIGDCAIRFGIGALVDCAIGEITIEDLQRGSRPGASLQSSIVTSRILQSPMPQSSIEWRNPQSPNRQQILNRHSSIANGHARKHLVVHTRCEHASVGVLA